MRKNDIGVIGLAVMGSNLATNIANHGYFVSVFNRTAQKTKDFLKNHPNKNIIPYFSINDFVNSLSSPRCIILMVQSGIATDNTIQSIIPHLHSNDIIVDGGNSFYQDTIQRHQNLLKKKINFIGMGISGGEYGALTGPAIMPGGDKKIYDIISPIFTSIAAKYNDESCINYIGPDGSGHYVKMVHNGIEYADMQIIAETYTILKNILFLSNQEISEIFNTWNQGELKSYLLDITKNILLKKEGKYDLIDLILDEACSKGTGIWTCQDALNLHESLTMITSSVFSRFLSSLKSQRMLASKILSSPKIIPVLCNQVEFIEQLRQALYLSKIISYAQGFSQLSIASKKYNWNLKFYNIAKIFRSGCIIQADILNHIVKVYKYDNNIINLLLSPYFQSIANSYHISLRSVISYTIQQGISIPTFSSAISYYDGYRTAQSSANLIQAQRDYFGSHTYKRCDKSGIYHTNWLQ
ncbi:NADP-dependent phosphogluconate dehydrogenase [Buchnera aphidicola]|uniref:NADP-dependent phosphogluconate dehydrogenase n=1 Tax=Buchnera aphidicola TaxID=9 RepID=UPI0031B87603